MKRYGSPMIIVTDRLASYGAALRVLRIKLRQQCGRWLNNRAKTHTVNPGGKLVHRSGRIF